MALTLAVVPLQTPGMGKRRLAGALDPEQRALLASAMLADVAASLASAGVDEVVVAAAGSRAEGVARGLGLDTVLDPVGRPGLNPVLAAATRRLGADRPQLIAAADLPCLTSADVVAVMDADAEVVVAPTSGGGTGLLLRRPASLIATAYGPGSAERHLMLARDVGVRAAVVERVGCEHDVDTLSDLAALLELEPGPATALALPHLLGRRAS